MMTVFQYLIRKIIALLLIVSLLLQQAAPVFADTLDISLTPDASLTQTITAQLQENTAAEWAPEVKADFVTELLDDDNLNLFQLFSLDEGTEKYDFFAVLCDFIKTGKFTDEQVLNLSTRTTYNLPREKTLWPVLAGSFVQNPQFVDLRSSLVASLEMEVSSISLGKQPDYLFSLLQVFGEDPSLSSFNSTEKESLIKSLRVLLATYAKHLAQDKSSERGRQSNLGLYAVSNEAVAARNYIDATNFFKSKDGDSFWKGFITTVIPFSFPAPGRNSKSEFTTDLIGQQHRLCYMAIEILLGKYISQKQDQKVYDFIRYEAMGQGPYYMQFAVDGLSIANVYYSQLSEARYNKWNQLQTKLDEEIQEAAPWEKKLLSKLAAVSQVAIEWVVLGKIISVVWKGVKFAASPLSKAFISLLPRNVVVRTALANRWVRLGFHRVASQSATKINNLVLNLAIRVSGRKPLKLALAKKYMLNAVEHSTLDETDKAAFKSFFKRVVINEADPETIRFLNSRLGQQYIGANTLRTLKAQVSRWMVLKPNANYRLVVRNGHWIAEVEIPKMVGLDFIKNSVGPAIKGKSFQNGRIALGGNKWIRFGQHELTSGSVHIHVEELVSRNGVQALINNSYKMKVKETLTNILHKDISQLWVLSTQQQRKNGLHYIFSNFSVTEIEKLFPSGGSGILLRQLNRYYTTGDRSALEALFRKIYANSKPLPTVWTEEEVENLVNRAGGELIKAIQNGARNNNATKQAILNHLKDIVTANISQMSNKEAGTILQWMLLEGTANRTSLAKYLLAANIRGALNYQVLFPKSRNR